VTGDENAAENGCHHRRLDETELVPPINSWLPAFLIKDFSLRQLRVLCAEDRRAIAVLGSE